MKHFAIGVAIALTLLVVTTPTTAKADSLTFTLNCTVSSTGCATSGPWGTVTISDDPSNSSYVDLSVSLNYSSATVQQLDLNFNGTPASGYSFSLTDGTGVQYSSNGVKADGYSTGKLDIQIPSTGNLGTNPWTGVLQLSNGTTLANLDPSMFNVQDSSSLVYLVVKDSNDGTGNSIWTGASNPGSPSQVPEPATLVLFGTGLSALAGAIRRKTK